VFNLLKRPAKAFVLKKKKKEDAFSDKSAMGGGAGVGVASLV